MFHLGQFLTSDVYSVNSWKDWVNDPSSPWTSSNYSSLEKVDDKITLGFVCDEMDNVDNPEVFETTTKELTYILDKWQEACEKKPNRIIITRDNGKVTVDFED